MIRTTKANYTKSLLEENSRDPTKFWNTIKRIFPSTSKNFRTEQSFKINGKSSTDKVEICDRFCKYFTEAVILMKKVTYPLIDFIWRKPAAFFSRTDKTFSFSYVSTVEVMNHLKRLKRKKSTGYDDLPPGMLNDSAVVIAQPLAYIIILSLRTGLFPSDWKVVKLLPFHKSGQTDIFEIIDPFLHQLLYQKLLKKLYIKG